MTYALLVGLYVRPRLLDGALNKNAANEAVALLVVVERLERRDHHAAGARTLATKSKGLELNEKQKKDILVLVKLRIKLIDLARKGTQLILHALERVDDLLLLAGRHDRCSDNKV